MLKACRQHFRALVLANREDAQKTIDSAAESFTVHPFGGRIAGFNVEPYSAIHGPRTQQAP
jgi:hypothetical protein